MEKIIFSDVLFVLFYTLVFVCWAFIFAYGIIQLNEKKKNKL
jgi:cytochrome bd-type quinol oxidase subunit 1